MKNKIKNMPFDEKLNSLSHLVGAVIGMIFLCLLLIFKGNSIPAIIGYSIYGFCFIWLFAMSTIYHGATTPHIKNLMRAVDHISIYFFIAGTYTPIVILGLTVPLRWWFLGLIWGLAIGGMVYKIFSYGQYKKHRVVSIIIYLAMGWLALLVIKPLYQQNSLALLIWLFLGGMIYSAGTYFYKGTKFKYSHFIWHIFVLLAAISHFVAVCLL